ncbi:hypothetical protein [Leptolyngbya sp. FACHB-711]|uniref:hypothetical protein n=1 Tax=Leptolyngbya sp. FACHB-711 TaxID=2692813 RepID=UPI001689BB73|nr:hypothetical protein [Leptolyngbya sp. FACHB-711]MBD1849037.1 hypothetical protein [Cyanobacteria bacterium FACHB-502]MBD2027888.1 hypothetical protein [Leptolyngbya sp. FACHB-711]
MRTNVSLLLHPLIGTGSLSNGSKMEWAIVLVFFPCCAYGRSSCASLIATLDIDENTDLE